MNDYHVRERNFWGSRDRETLISCSNYLITIPIIQNNQ